MRTPKEIISGADLSGADLSGYDLRCANLRGANLSNAIIGSANLRRANLRGADLTCAYLKGADLSYADLSGANLILADLRDASLTGADLLGADLTGADLKGADIKGAVLSGANLHDVNLNDVKGLYFPYACPDHGKFKGWKKAITIRNPKNTVLVELEIPEDAKRSSATGRKCRCDKAKVLSIRDLQGNVLNEDKAFSMYDNNFVYKVGEMLSVSNFNSDRWIECGNGIHFFINMQEAVNY